MSDNFCILVLNRRVVQLLNRVIKVGADIGHLIEQLGCRSGRNIAGGA